MVITIDANSGFCFGVVRAVKIAEEELSSGESFYCLGEIVHNQCEVERLKSLGLIFIDHTQFKELKNYTGPSELIIFSTHLSVSSLRKIWKKHLN